jgi:hypothetical protein
MIEDPVFVPSERVAVAMARAALEEWMQESMDAGQPYVFEQSWRRRCEETHEDIVEYWMHVMRNTKPPDRWLLQNPSMAGWMEPIALSPACRAAFSESQIAWLERRWTALKARSQRLQDEGVVLEVPPTRVPNPHKRSVPLGLRFKVLTRDNHTCVYCGRTSAEVPLHVDHSVAWSRGGKTTIDNLRTACADCNIGKGAN